MAAMPRELKPSPGPSAGPVHGGRGPGGRPGGQGRQGRAGGQAGQGHAAGMNIWDTCFFYIVNNPALDNPMKIILICEQKFSTVSTHSVLQ